MFWETEKYLGLSLPVEINTILKNTFRNSFQITFTVSTFQPDGFNQTWISVHCCSPGSEKELFITFLLQTFCRHQAALLSLLFVILGKKALLLQLYAEPFKAVQMTEMFLCDYMVVPRMAVISTPVHEHSARIDAVTSSHFSSTFWEHICFHFELVWGIFFKLIKKVNNI